MTPQQALEEAKKRYPNGTRYRCVFHDVYEYTVESKDGFSIFNDKCIYGERNKGVLYDFRTDTWAEVIQPAKSLDERLVEEYGFVKDTFNHGECTINRYEKGGVSIDFDYQGKNLLSIKGAVEVTSFQNPNNLEAFIKAYLDLF